MSQFRVGAIKRSKWALIALVFIFTQFIPLINVAGEAEATSYTLASSNGIWTNAAGAGTTLEGLNTTEIKWGYPTVGSKKSGLKFDGQGSQTFSDGTRINLGKLTHKNWPVYPPTANSATLQVTLNFSDPVLSPNPSFSFNFLIDETENEAPCAYSPVESPCPDKITFQSSYPTQSFELNDKLYTLKIEGFSSSSSTITPVSQFITQENKDNEAWLIGTITSVLVERPNISLVEKAVNGNDADSTPGITLNAGETANFTYNVQNTGNVTLSSIAVHDDKGVIVSCPKTTLEPGENMICTGSAIAIVGQYTNTAYATGEHTSGTVTSNNEVANYFGIAPARVTINKVVENAFGGNATASDFSMMVNGNPVVQNTDLPLVAGTYTISENQLPGYVLDRVEGNCTKMSDTTATLTVTANQTATCTFINKDMQPTITLHKNIENNYQWGDTTSTHDGFGLKIGRTTVTSGQALGVNSNQDYTIDEAGAPGYEFVSIGGRNCPINNLGQSINLGEGESADCYITNRAMQPIITLKKTAINNNGGNKQSGEFVLLLNGAAQPYTGGASIVDPTNSSITTTTYTDKLYVGKFIPSEVPTTGYTQLAGWNCVDKSGQPVILDADGAFDLKLGSDITCAITNDDEAPMLTLFKSLNPELWGSGATGADFTLKATLVGQSVPAVQGEDEDATDVTSDVNSDSSFQAGTYNLSEDSQKWGSEQYIKSDWSCLVNNTSDPIVLPASQLTLGLGANASCWIVNTIVPAKVQIIKEVVNDNGGNATINDFAININGQPSPVFGSPVVSPDGYTKTYTIQAMNLPAGNYVLSENRTSEYEEGTWSCGVDSSTDDLAQTSLQLNNGDSVTCTIRNDDIAPSLEIQKRVINNNGGTKMSEEFNLFVNGQSVEFKRGGGEVADNSAFGLYENPMANTTYTVTETSSEPAYKQIDLSCLDNDTGSNLNHPITLAPGQNALCTITNDDQQAYIIVDKTVDNSSGGTAIPDDFKLTIDGNAALDGVPYPVYPGEYTVGETNLPGYASGNWGGQCDTKAKVTVALGETKTCTITNDDIPPVLIIHKDTYPDSDEDFEFDITTYCGCSDTDFRTIAESDCQCDDWFKQTVQVPASGSATINTLPAGQYMINEDVPDGWQLTDNIFCTPGNHQYNGDNVVVTLEIGKTVDCYFTNEKLSSVYVTKYHDKNQNGVRDNYFGQGLEPVLEGFEFKLHSELLPEPLTAVSDANGIATFANIPSGSYWIEEVERDGWSLTKLRCDSNERAVVPTLLRNFISKNGAQNGNENEWFYVDPDNKVACDAGNASSVHYYDIAKSNNATTVKRVGDIVVYTITLTIPETTGVLYNPRVGDVTPKGFSYLTGSWTANSNLRGDLKPGISVEPTYASPGIWRFNGFDTYYDVGNTVPNNAFYPGEVITLTYQTKIQDDVTAGTYPDIALSFAFTTQEEDEQDRSTAVLANVTNQGGATPFVGTDVTVVTDTPQPATTLINTGSSALGALLLGAALIAAGLATRSLRTTERRL